MARKIVLYFHCYYYLLSHKNIIFQPSWVLINKYFVHKIENVLICQQFQHLFWVLKGAVSLSIVLLNTHNISFS